MFTVAILAGGLGTRLRPISEKIPKALLEVAGRPFIHHQLELLAAQGVARVVLCVGYLGEMVQAAVGDGRQFGVRVEYSFDGDMLLGTGGALKRALPLLGKNFIVLYGDSYLPCPFAPIQESFLDSGAPALMTVLRNENRWDKSNVLFRDGRIVEYNKCAPRVEMEHIDYGLGILSADVLAAPPEGLPFDLAGIYQILSFEGRLAGYEVKERFYEIGSHQGIRETEEYLSSRRLT